MSVTTLGQSFPANAKVKYYYKLSEKQDLDAFVNSIFVGSYKLKQISYLLYGNTKIVSAPVVPLGPNASIIIDDELQEGLYLIRIKVYNTNSFSVTVTPFFNNNNTMTYSIGANSEFEIYDIFTKEQGNIYYIQLPPGLAILEFSLERVFEKGNRINIPKIIHTSGNGYISFRLRKGTYAIKMPYSYNNTTSTTFTNFQFGTISTSVATIPLVISSIPANGSGSGTFLVYLKITGDYEDVKFSVTYGGGLGVPFTFGLEVEEINELVENTNFVTQSVTLSGSQVTQSILNVQGSGSHLRLKYASVSGLTTAVTQCQLQATNLNRSTTYSTVWDFIAGGSSTPPSWDIREINSIQLVANGGSSTSSVTITLILVYEQIAGELS
ncbi:hypothetical protein C381 [Sulfolobus turreted icosahedral virus 1]|uniref:Uncharacterized protein n=2 Tax=Sulfolobus turreted icosahedral virus 1 TaxID=269145 RepID=Q6Q0L3_9VIRU|nr:hypothetical protein C381 [Sulfolobus turreted icosahedral virus 1]AAS89078.1 hypothetical protein C381 [Sulfolobus turreted icosahedral virus 1]3J31_P Chain P, C381 turret protein [Sulfolobus turreted icosahedral virus 1]